MGVIIDYISKIAAQKRFDKIYRINVIYQGKMYHRSSDLKKVPNVDWTFVDHPAFDYDCFEHAGIKKHKMSAEEKQRKVYIKQSLKRKLP